MSSHKYSNKRTAAAAATAGSKTTHDSIVIDGRHNDSNTVQFTLESTFVSTDATYSSQRDIWETVPCGYTNVFAGMPANPLGIETAEPVLVSQIRGLRKFGGQSDACYGYPDKVRTIIALCTTDCEYVQIGAFVLNNTQLQCNTYADYDDDDDRYETETAETAATAAAAAAAESTDESADIRYWVVGSKHAHLVFRHDFMEEDLEKYTDNSRYAFALRVAQLFNNTVLCNTFVDIDGFHDWLCEHKFTANAEAVFSDQPCMDYTTVDDLRFFATTSHTSSKTGLTAQHPLSALSAFSTFGLQTVCVSCKDGEDSQGSQGSQTNEVFYGISTEGHVCAIWKQVATVL
jgi:hypothetical protein